MPGHRTAKRLMRDLPREILQHVFFFTVSDGAGNRNYQALHDICSVDREWRHTAVDRCALWTQLPRVDLGDMGTQAQVIQRTISMTTLFLARSGALPISFQLSVENSVLYSPNAVAVRSAIDLLVDQCHRWDEVELKFSELTYRQLVPIKRNLPVLTSLKLDIPHLYLRDGDLHNVFDLFEDAPRLRRVDTGILCRPIDGNILPIFPPWSQLEYFKYSAQEEEVYHMLLETRPVTLRTLEYRIPDLHILPRSVTLTLPLLEKFVLRIKNGIECDFLAHLSTLTLPSLAHLELWGRLRLASQDPYDAVLRLVRRSSCSLQTLYICLANDEQAAANADADAFKGLMALSPNLEILHTLPLKSELLKTLILDTASPESLLPRLRVLSFHAHGTMVRRRLALDTPVLGSVIESRTLALRDREDVQYSMLDEVIFVYYADVGVHLALFPDSFIKGLDENIDPRSRKTILKVMNPLYWSFTAGGTWLWYQQHYNPLHLGRMHLTMRRLESLDFKKRHTEVLMRYGLPSLMHRIGEHCTERLPEDVIVRFRSRARKLVAKWKPFILRDVRAASYRWCYYGGGIASLKWNHGQEGIEKDDEEVWRDIIGIGDRSSAYVSLKK